ncbi:TPA: glycosyltransferase [Vibrio harveyi]|uniref:glycosyltransferase n=1 Tax=Vibrio harveyi TaxID=669 RepID=UPI0039091AF8
MNTVLFCGPQYLNLNEKAGGVFKEMELRAEALNSVGWNVQYLRQDQTPDWDNISLVHVFMANESTYGLVKLLKEKKKVVVSPIIDRTEKESHLRILINIMSKIPKMHSNLTRAKDICNLSDEVVIRSSEEKRKLNIAFGVNGGVVVKLPYKRVDLTEEEITLKVTKRQVFFLGDLGNERKNVHRLIQACDELGVNLVLAGVIGNDQYSKKVKTLISQSETTQYLGKITESEKYKLLLESEVFCLPSLMEGVGIAALEALDLHCKVIISKNGGVRDYFLDAVQYVNPNSLDDMKTKISAALNNKEKPECGDVFDALNLNKIGLETINVYKKVLCNEI